LPEHRIWPLSHGYRPFVHRPVEAGLVNEITR
jgi:hypothetical protein